MTFDRFVILILFGLIGAQPLLAQQAVDRSADWRTVSGKLEQGAYEVVWLLDGSKITGTFVQVSGDLIEVRPRTRFPVPSRQVPFSEVKMIRQGRSDSLINGALWGLVAGAGGALVVVGAYTCSGCHWDPPWFPLAMAGLYGGIGAGVGIGIDALLRSGERVIYSKPAASTPTVRVTPLLGRERKGVFLSVGF